VKNKVPYNIFQKWYKDTRNKIVEVQVVGIPADEDDGKPVPAVKPEKALVSTDNSIRIWIELRISNGLHLLQKHYAT